MYIYHVFRSVGISTAAFALAILEGSTQPGVWFPEEVPPLEKVHLIPCMVLLNVSINSFVAGRHCN